MVEFYHYLFYRASSYYKDKDFPVYSPVIQITPGSSVSEQVMEGLKISYEQFVEYMERFKREQYRTAF